PADMFDPSDNIRYGTFYLRWLLDYLDGDFELAVSSYNRGQGYIRRLFEGEVVAGDKDEFYREIDALEGRSAAAAQLARHGVDSLIVIGGDGSLRGAQLLREEQGVRVIGVPATID